MQVRKYWHIHRAEDILTTQRIHAHKTCTTHNVYTQILADRQNTHRQGNTQMYLNTHNRTQQQYTSVGTYTGHSLWCLRSILLKKSAIGPLLLR